MPKKQKPKTEPLMYTREQYRKVKLQKLKTIEKALESGQDLSYNLECIKRQICILEDRPVLTPVEDNE